MLRPALRLILAALALIIAAAGFAHAGPTAEAPGEAIVVLVIEADGSALVVCNVGRSAWANEYAYCGGDPVNRTDPTGLWWLLQYQIAGENDTPPLFTIEHDGVQIGARWVPEPGMPNAPNPKGWQEVFQGGADLVDNLLVASPTGAIGIPANHPVKGFNGFDFAAADAASWTDVGGFLFAGGESSYRYLHRNDRESYLLQAALQADPTLAHRLVNGAFTAIFGAEAIGAALPVVAPALGSGLVSAGSSLASAARTTALATRVALGGNIWAATYVVAPTATAATILGGEVLSGLTGAPSPTPVTAAASAGRAAQIALGGGRLTARQAALLEEVAETGAEVLLRKRAVSLADLSALTAKTGDEFALLTRGSQRLLIRGHDYALPTLSVERAEELAAAGWRWSGHTHPGLVPSVLRPSGGDEAVLWAFFANGNAAQTRSAILNSTGRWGVLNLEDLVPVDPR